MKKVALFDFDNTIYNGYTYEDFIVYVSETVLKTDKYPNKAKHILKIASEYDEMVAGIADVVGEIIKGWSHEKFEKYCKISCSKRKILDWVAPVTDCLKLNGFENIAKQRGWFLGAEPSVIIKEIKKNVT